MTNKNHKISGQVSLGIMVVGSLVGLGLLTAAVFNNAGLSFQNKNNLLAQVASTGTASRVFITSANYSGNLGGLAGADSKCQTAANSASLGGTWKVWLSDTSTSASSRLEHSLYPYQLLNGVTLANNWTDLTDGTLLAPINYTEKNTAKTFDVYTNTTVAGGIVSTNLSNTCENWTSLSGDGYFGGPSTNSYWTDRGLTYYCGSNLALYCVEQLGAAAVVPPSAPSIKVLSPNGGEKLEVGKPYTITWSASGLSLVNLILYRGNNCSITTSGTQVCGNVYDLSPTPPTAIAVNVFNNGSYNWTVLTSVPNGDDYRVAVQNPNNLPQLDQSDAPFTITAPATLTPSIKVVSPNGGETFQQGQTIPITWSSANMGSLHAEIDLLGVDSTIMENSRIVLDTANTGSYNWTIPITLPNGSYRILISSTDKGPSTSDVSDNYFTIGAPTPPPTINSVTHTDGSNGIAESFIVTGSGFTPGSILQYTDTLSTNPTGTLTNVISLSSTQIVFSGNTYTGNVASIYKIKVVDARGYPSNEKTVDTRTTPISQPSSRVFITSSNYTGNLGGLSGADSKCQTSATNAGLSGTWKAWLSDSYTSASARLEHSSNPYQLLNGTLLANNWTDLTDGTLAAPINYTEKKTAKSFDVYTNTTATGERKSVNSSQNCRNWTENIYSGYFGGPATNSAWTDGNLTYGCGNALALYCVEQLGSALSVPALTVSVSTAPQAQNVIAGTNQFEFARYILDATTSGENLRIIALPVLYKVVGTGNYTDLTNCKLYDGSTSTTDYYVMNPAGSQPTFTFDGTGLTLTKGYAKQLSLKCDLKSAATGSYQWGLSDAPLPPTVGATSGKEATITLNPGLGQTMTAITSGTLSVALNTQGTYQIVTPGQTVTLAELKFSASGEDVAVKQLSLMMSGGITTFNSPDDLVNREVALWDGATQVGTAIFANGYNAIGTLTGFTVPKDGFKVLSVRGKIAGISVSDAMNRSGDLLKVDYDGGSRINKTYGVGVSSGQTILPTGTYTNSTGVRIMKAYPVLTKLNLTNAERVLVAGDNRTLYKFQVTAKNGDIAIYQFTFKVPELNGYNLHVFTDSSFSVSDANFTGGGFGYIPSRQNAVINFTKSAATGSGYSYTDTSLVIPNGQSRYFQLTGAIPNSMTILQTQLAGDANYPVGGMQSAYGITTDASGENKFIWSPNSTTTASLSTNDWTNGYGVPGLPSTNMPAETLSTSGTAQDSQSELSALLEEIATLQAQLGSSSGTTQPATTQSVRTTSAAPAGVTPVTACDATVKAVLDLAGGCGQLNSSQYPSIYRACCSLPSTTSVTKETILRLLNNALGDGRIDESEKADLLKALNDYLAQ